MRHFPRLPVVLALLTLSPTAALAEPSALASSPAGEADSEALKPWLAPSLSAGVALAGYGAALVAALPSGDIQPWQTGCLIGGLSLGVLGPAAGHLYTGHYGRAAAFSVGRATLAVIALAGLDGLVSHSDSDGADFRQGETLNATLFLGGAAGVLALSIWEGIDSYHSAQARNAERRTRQVALAPYVVPGRGSGSVSAAGVMLAGRF